jgi:hypothetical protein
MTDRETITTGIPLDELKTLCEAYKDGRAVVLPKEVWRICANPYSTDFNGNSEKSVIKYYVFAFDKDANRYWVNRNGWNGLKLRHWVNADSCYPTKETAKKALEGKE